MNLNWKALLVVASLAVGSGLVACDSSTTTPKTGESTAPDTKGDAMKSPEASKSPDAKGDAMKSPEASKSPDAKGDAMKSPEASKSPEAKKK